MPSYKLTYFHLTGLAEPIRLVFNYAGIEFVDERIDKNDWPKFKLSTCLININNAFTSVYRAPVELPLYFLVLKRKTLCHKDYVTQFNV